MRLTKEIMYDELRHYGNMLADKNHETTEGNFIRFTTYEFEGKFYVVVMYNGGLMNVYEDEELGQLVW